MSNVVLKIENLSKQYRLGQVGTGTLSHDINRWWHKVRGKEDPYALVGQTNDRSQKAESDYVWALKDINFEVKEGDVLGIIGKNGAGKSTLLKIISQITAPTTGNIKAKGRIASLLEVGTGMHPEMTARENIYLNGAILGMKKKEIDAKFDEIIDFSGCTMYVDTPIKRFSSGMRVRLGFAVAAFLEPEILIVDEVLAVGDAEFQKKAIGKMQEISSGHGRTVIFVSHNMSSVQTLCNKAILLENGHLIYNDSTKEVITKYLNNEIDQLDLDKLSINTKKIPRRTMMGEEVKIISFSFLDNQYIQSNNINYGEDLCFKIVLQSYKNISNLEICIVIKTIFETRLTVFNSESFNMQKDEKKECIVKVNNFILNINNYFKVDVTLRQGHGRKYDHLTNVISFKINDIIVERNIINYKRKDGLVVVNSTETYFKTI